MADERGGGDNNNVEDNMGNQLQLLPGEKVEKQLVSYTRALSTVAIV